MKIHDLKSTGEKCIELIRNKQTEQFQYLFNTIKYHYGDNKTDLSTFVKAC